MSDFNAALRERFRSTAQIIRDALTAELSARLAECTEAQRAVFKRVFPNEIGKLSEEQLRNAVDVCQRTVHKNITTGRTASTPTSAGGRDG